MYAISCFLPHTAMISGLWPWLTTIWEWYPIFLWNHHMRKHRGWNRIYHRRPCAFMSLYSTEIISGIQNISGELLSARETMMASLYTALCYNGMWPYMPLNASTHYDVNNGNNFRVTGHLCGNSPVTGEFPAQRPVTRSFDVFFDLRLNKRLSKQWWGLWLKTRSL